MIMLSIPYLSKY